MSSTTANLWDEVWAEYDARHAPRAMAVARPATPASAARARRAGRARWWVAGVLALGFAGYAAAPVLAAQHVTAALAGADAAGMAGLVDWSAVQAGLSGELAAATHALPPGRTAGLSGAGLDFLQGMARDVSAGMSTAEGLANLMRRRLGVEGRATLAPAQFHPEGLTRARMVLASADGSDGHVTMTLALTDPLRLRWQVVAVELKD
jgi:hypothetical protein